MNNNCERCHKPTNVTIMSFFNEDMICMDCKKKEEAHPKYKEAHDEEVRQVRAGNYNFKGTGKPDDL